MWPTFDLPSTETAHHGRCVAVLELGEVFGSNYTQPIADPEFAQRIGYDILTVQELLGHKDVATTMIYTHVLKRLGVLPVRSPLD